MEANLRPYLQLNATLDLFIRHVKELPAECELHNNLSYLDREIQKLLYKNFKTKIREDKSFHEALLKHQPFSCDAVQAIVQTIIKDLVPDYKEKPSDQEQEMWNIYVMEVNVGIERLSKQYHGFLQSSHETFSTLRTEQLTFIKNYFDRCLFLAQLEEWLTQAPLSQVEQQLQPSSEELNLAFCQSLLQFEKSHNEVDVASIKTRLEELQKTSLAPKQHETIAKLLIQLKPQYDAYRLGQASLDTSKQLQEFTKLWPTTPAPTLYQWTPQQISNTAEASSWKDLRSKQRSQETKQTGPIFSHHKKSKKL